MRKQEKFIIADDKGSYYTADPKLVDKQGNWIKIVKDAKCFDSTLSAEVVVNRLNFMRKFLGLPQLDLEVIKIT